MAPQSHPFSTVDMAGRTPVRLYGSVCKPGENFTEPRDSSSDKAESEQSQPIPNNYTRPTLNQSLTGKSGSTTAVHAVLRGAHGDTQASVGQSSNISPSIADTTLNCSFADSPQALIVISPAAANATRTFDLVLAAYDIWVPDGSSLPEGLVEGLAAKADGCGCHVDF